VPAAVGLVCGTYTMLYLVRWEWNRAIIAGLFFVAVEMIVVALVLVERLRRVEARLDALAAGTPQPPATPAPTDPALAALRETAPPPADRFAWIRDQAGQTNVFLPVLLGAGVLASALAWAVEHVARSTLTPARERHLADRLGALRFPAGGFLASAPVTVEPASHRVRRALTAAGLALAVIASGVCAVAGIDFVADRTQTRPDAHIAGVGTVIELELLGTLARRDPERIVGHLWAMCTGPDVFRARTLPAPATTHGPGARVTLDLDAHVGEHALARLRGCLNDTTLDRVQARVLRAGLVGS
jgi:hypothetical protein